MTISINAKIAERCQQEHADEVQRERKHQGKNSGFLQLTKSHIPQTRLLAKNAPAAFQVIMILVEKMNRQNAVACSQNTLAKITGYSLPTIKRAIAHLENERWIQIIKIGTSNAYAVNSKVFWQDTREGRFATFSATIIAEESEQTTKPEAWEGIELKHFPYIYPGEQAVLTGEDNNQKELDV